MSSYVTWEQKEEAEQKGSKHSP